MKVRAKKSLGQNFLIDKDILKKIVDLVKIKDETILEVGPGTGNLTSFILEKEPKQLLVVEKDNELVSILNKNFDKKITIINEDILKVNEKDISKNPIVVFGNLPYNISTEIICKWILNLNNQDFWFNNLILMSLLIKIRVDIFLYNDIYSSYYKLSKWVITL